jgi:cytochrome c biogenesis protein CcmG, thiol:disulfide interchange protein DsbE
MSVAVERTLAPSHMAVRVLDPCSRLRWSRTIARHVGVIGAGHRLCATATAGDRRTGIYRRCQQDGRKNFQHVFTLLVGTMMPHIPDWFQRRARAQPRYLIWAAAATLLWLVSEFSAGPAFAAPEIGGLAPPLIVTAFDGVTFDLAKLRGKVVLVNYWATWCAPCRKEMPKLDAFYKHYHGQGLQIIGISIDFPRDYEKARKAAQAVTYPTALVKGISADGFGIPKGVPITWIIDVDGKIRDRMIEVRDELLNGIVVPLLPH